MSIKKMLFYLFDLIGYDRGKFNSQLLCFLKGSGETAQIGHRPHVDQAQSLFIRRLQNTEHIGGF